MSGDPSLDDPVGASLRGAHAHLARRRGNAATYVEGVATFSSVPLNPAPGDWADLAHLLGAAAFADMFSNAAPPPAGWAEVFTLEALQLLAPAGAGLDDPEVEVLGPADVPAILDLVELTRPGPFWPRTLEMGTYRGIRVDGHLVAMAGERLRPPGWTEISAVCTDPAHRGQGYAARVVLATLAGIEARGERGFLHVVGANTTARALYERLGFTTRRAITFQGFTTP